MLKVVNLEVDYFIPIDEVPATIKVDEEGNIYLHSEYNSYFIDKFDENGKLITKFIVNKSIDKFEQYIKNEKSIFYDKKNVVVNGVELYSDANDNVYIIVAMENQNESEIGNFFNEKSV